MGPDEALSSLLLLGQVALDAADYESAVNAYASALKIKQDETAAYNLGSLYARGLGVRKNYLEAARLFHESELMGNDRAGKLCMKCMFDFIDEQIEGKDPLELYSAMAVFVSMAFPEAPDKPAELANGLSALASTYASKGEQAKAEKLILAQEHLPGK